MKEYNKDLVLVFNMNLVYHYIRNGVNPVGVPQCHHKTHKIFFIFDRKQTQSLYDEWIKNIK